jgi:acyl dehydratase
MAQHGTATSPDGTGSAAAAVSGPAGRASIARAGVEQGCRMPHDPAAPRLFLEDLPIGEDLDCGGFSLSRNEIIAFAARFDPQPWHLDDALAAASAFGTLVASGVHTQAAAIGLMVRRIADVAVLFGGSLHESRFQVPVRPDVPHAVVARWTQARPSASRPGRGVAHIEGRATDPRGREAMSFGVTYIVARRP